MTIRLSLWQALALCLLYCPVARAQRQPPPPRFVELRLAGVDLLHAGADALQKRFGSAETADVPAGRAYRWRDPQAGFVLEMIADEESGSIKMARVARSSFLPPSSLHSFRLPRPLTGAGISPGDTMAAVERAYGKPHKIERGKGGRADYLYNAPMRPDGSLPAYRARYTFLNGRLDGPVIALGE
jgi:hypothetical protein